MNYTIDQIMNDPLVTTQVKESFRRRIRKLSGHNLQSHATPFQYPITVSTGMSYKVTLEYLCELPGLHILANVYKQPGIDFEHKLIHLEYGCDFRTVEFIVNCEYTHHPMSGHVRIWGDNTHKVFIRNVKVENIGRNYVTLQERLSKFPRDDNLIVIVDKNRRRSPLLSFFQDQLCSMKSDFNFVRETNTDKNVIEIINGLGVIPGYIFTGFRTDNYLDKNVDLLRSNKIKVICETGDPWLFNRQRFYRSILSMRQQGVKVVALVSHSSDGIENITNPFPEIPLIVVPWMMNKVLDSGRVRSIDVAWVGTVSSFKHHTNKRKVNEIIMKIKGVNIYHKKTHGENYLKVLKDSKIFVVAGRVKDTMVQKYVEGAMCGCLMIGELPSEGRHILEGGMVEVQKGDYHDLEHKIKYYLKNSKERKQITKTGQKAMCKYRNPKEICETFISDLKGVIHGKT